MSSAISLTKQNDKELAKAREKATAFLLDYSPNLQGVICNDMELCFFGDFPTLAKVNATLGNKVSTAWLVPQLANLSEFCGCKDKITPYQVKECAMLIAQNYYYLKVSELMLFFNRFKQGKYGRFYGAVDPLVIMTALQSFLRDRADAIFHHDSEENYRRMKEEAKHTMTYEEYQRRKAMKKNQPQMVQQ